MVQETFESGDRFLPAPEQSVGPALLPQISIGIPRIEAHRLFHRTKGLCRPYLIIQYLGQPELA
jgi:hypothetical protein